MKKIYRTRNTGNSVADMTETIETCCKCHGLGTWELLKSELEKFLHENRYMLRLDELFEYYRDWKKTGSIKCPNCNGKGVIKDRY